MIHITNEELNILENMNDAEIGEKMGLVKFIRRLSADLLEARELIKEMREVLSEVLATASPAITNGELVYIGSFKDIRELLEKSSEYE